MVEFVPQCMCDVCDACGVYLHANVRIHATCIIDGLETSLSDSYMFCHVLSVLPDDLSLIASMPAVTTTVLVSQGETMIQKSGM